MSVSISAFSRSLLSVSTASTMCLPESSTKVLIVSVRDCLKSSSSCFFCSSYCLLSSVFSSSVAVLIWFSCSCSRVFVSIE
ncbi:MAG: hypothetical protein ACI4GV_08330 [Acutalibacteraceae bacterium]